MVLYNIMSPNLAAFSCNNPLRLIFPSALSACVAFGLVSMVVPMSSAEAQRIAYQRVALTGMRTDVGVATVRVGSFGPPAISSSGAVAYRSIIYGQGVTANNADTIVRQRARSIEVIARRFGRVPAGFVTNPDMILRKEPYSNPPAGTSYAVVGYFPYYTDFDSQVAINDAGEVAFSNTTGLNAFIRTTVTPAPPAPPTVTITEINPFADILYYTQGGTPTSAIIKDWAYDPGAMNNYELPVNLYGVENMVFIGTRQPGGLGESTGIYNGTPFTFRALAVVDRPVAGLPIGTTFSDLELPGINYGGIVSTNATVNGPNSALFQGIWNYSADGEPNLFIGPTTLAPDTGNGTFSDITSRVSMNPSGQMAFTATVADGALPVSGGIFVGRLRVDGLNRGIPNNISLLMPDGAIAPTKTVFSPSEITDARFSTVSQPTVNARGTVVFSGTISGTGVEAGRNDTGIWAIVPRAAGVDRTPKPIIRTGDRIRIDGRMQTVGVITFEPMYALSNRNEVVFTVTFLNGTSGIFKALLLPEA